jgi:hypothetical protein
LEGEKDSRKVFIKKIPCGTSKDQLREVIRKCEAEVVVPIICLLLWYICLFIILLLVCYYYTYILFQFRYYLIIYMYIFIIWLFTMHNFILISSMHFSLISLSFTNLLTTATIIITIIIIIIIWGIKKYY